MKTSTITTSDSQRRKNAIDEMVQAIASMTHTVIAVSERARARGLTSTTVMRGVK